jgi:hypothetical protein
MKPIFYTKSVHRSNFLNLNDIYLKVPGDFTKKHIIKIKSIIYKTKLHEILIEIPHIKSITVLKFSSDELLVSLQQSDRDEPSMMIDQIDFIQVILPTNVSIFPYKTKRTVYKFSITLNEYQLFY